MNNKVLIIGLDGASWNVLELFWEHGYLNNLKKLFNSGVKGYLKSTHPPMSPTAWTSFLTGVNPGKHGIYGFGKRGKGKEFYEQKRLTARDILVPTMWEILSQRKKQIISINVPMTFPPEKINGYLISGFLCPSTDVEFTFPSSLKEELLSLNINYKIDLESDLMEGEPVYLIELLNHHNRKLIDELLNITKNRLKTALYLIKKRWDIFMIVFVGMDRIQHWLWDYLDKNNSPDSYITSLVTEYYEYLDQCIKQIIEKALSKNEKINIIFLSDHGFSKLKGVFYVNKWLEKLGLFYKKKKGKKILFYLKEGLKKLGITRKRLSRYVPESKLTSLYPTVSEIDWYKTKAYSSYINGININLKGREPCGTVNPGNEFEQIRKLIIPELFNLRNPETGKPIVKNVHKKEDIYWGDAIHLAPDLVIEFSEDELFATSSKYDSHCVLETNIAKKGSHSMYGIFSIIGDGIKKIQSYQQAEIIDLMPTIFYILNEPIPQHIDGKPLIDFFVEEYIKNKPIKIEKKEISKISKAEYKYSPEEEKELEEKLKSLGYID